MVDSSGGGGGWDVLDTIKAVAALAVAAGAGYSAYASSKKDKSQIGFQQDQLAQQGLFHTDEMAQADKNRALTQQGLDLQKQQFESQKPLNAMSLLSGLQDYKTKRMQGSSYLDTVRALGRS